MACATPTTLYSAKAWGMRSAERRKMNLLEMKCLRSMVVVSRMDRVIIFKLLDLFRQQLAYAKEFL